MRAFRDDRGPQDATFDLNLAPMLDIIVSIVPMLLLSVVFLELSIVDTQIPQVVAQAIERDKKNERDLSISMHVASDRSIKIVVKDQGKESSFQVPKAEAGINGKALHEEIVRVKSKYPDVFRMEIHPDEAVEYNDLIAIMDKVRSRETGDPKIFFKDVETGKDVETDLIFPDVVFGNVTEG